MQEKHDKAYYYKFEYEKDKENIDLLFSNIDDTTQTMESIINFIMSGQGEFANLESWKSFLNRLAQRGEAGGNFSGGKEITANSWRKFQRIANKSIKNNSLFSDLSQEKRELRIADKISNIKKNDVVVIDIAKLNSDMQSFVFGNTVREIIDLRLREDDENSEYKTPSKIIIFIDELNKFASGEVPKNSPILKQILEIAERGRSLGVILFGAEQFKSAIHDRVTGNCSTMAYGRTNAIELSKSDYRYVPNVYKNMMTRLKQGEYIIQNPLFRSMLNIKFLEPIYKQFK
jgi:DNA helicase HerA-like ATPase